MRASSLALVLLLTTACSGEQSLTLGADPRAFPADGLSVVELTASVVFRGQEVDDGRDVVFRASHALLFEQVEDVAPGEGASEVEASTRGGKARVYLLSPVSAADIRVEASFTTVNREVLEDTLVVEAGAPRLISAGQYNSDPTQMVVQFGVACSARNVGGVDNIGAFVSGRDDIRVPCSLLLRDFSGRDLPNTPVRFYAEAGDIEDLPADDDGPRRVTYVVPPSPVVLPRDVEPISAETSHNLVDFDGTGRSVNPRDGLVSILAVVRGHEAFDDANGNGQYDDGEAFLDEGEPFLDIDDDGTFDEEIDPPPCCDSNDNGRVDGPNGRFDEGVWLGRMTHILWSGSVDLQRSAISPSGLAIDPGSSAELRLRVVDANFNPVAGGEPDDEVELSVSTSKLLLEPATSAALPNHIGMVLRSHPDFLFGYDTPVLADFIMDDPVLLFRDWAFTLSDDRDPESSAMCTAQPWIVEATVSTTPAPGMSSRDAVISTTGVLSAEACPEP